MLKDWIFLLDCNYSVSDSLQFRWLQTSVFGGSAGIRDVWFVDILK